MESALPSAISATPGTKILEHAHHASTDGHLTQANVNQQVNKAQAQILTATKVMQMEFALSAILDGY